MRIVTIGMAGTLESSDILVVLEPKESEGIQIYMISTVEKQFGKQIRKVINETLKELDIDNALVKVNDKGALDCVIKSRVQTAAYRAARSQEYEW